MITIQLSANDLYQIALWMVAVAIALGFVIRDTLRAMDWWEFRKARKRRMEKAQCSTSG